MKHPNTSEEVHNCCEDIQVAIRKEGTEEQNEGFLDELVDAEKIPLL